MKFKSISKLTLFAAFLCGGASAAWAVDVPTPVYTQNFESASTTVGSAGSNFGITGATLTGSGAIQTGDPKFGQYYKNASGVAGQSTRANFLTLSTTAFTSMTSPKATTISFWMNADGAWGNYWGTIFVAYGSTGNSGHGYPFSFDTRACLAVHSSLYETHFDDNGNIVNDWRTSGADFASSWHHVALVYSLDESDASAPKVVINQYIDGTLKQTYNLANGNGEHPTVSMFDHFEQLTEFVIGGNSPVWEDPDNNYAYDEIAIYDQALSAEQVNQIITDKNTAHTYTVNAVAGGSTLQELANSNTYPNVNYSANAPRVIYKDTKYYVLNDDQDGMNGFQATYTMGTANVVKEINYTLDESIVYFSEADDFNPSAKTASATASAGYYCNYYSTPVAIGLSSIGVYQLETNVTSRDANSSLEVYTESGTSSVALIGKNSGLGIKTVNFIATDGMRVGGPYYSDNFQNSKGVDYVLIRKLYDIADPSAVVGDVNYSGYATSSNYTLKKGDTKVFTFQNYGNASGESWDNWRINVIEGETWKSVTRADSWDEKGGDAGTGAATKVSYKVSKDGGSSKVNLDWGEYKSDLANARVVATLVYGLDGTLAITTTSTSANNGYIYYVDQDVTGLTSDLTVNLAANYSWLEVLSVENTAVGTTINSTGWTTFSSDYALDFSSVPATLKAYMITDHSGDVVTTSKVTGTVPAGTGLLLNGTASTSYSIPTVASSDTNVDDNLLVAGQGTLVTGGDDMTFVLAKSKTGDQAMFKKLDGTGATIAKGKAYLKFKSAVSAPALYFDFGDVTGISKTEAAVEAVEAGTFYNLAGQRVAQPAKGLYIVNGKKYVVK